MGSMAGRSGRVVSTSDIYAGGIRTKSGMLPLLKHAYGESDWQVLAIKRLVGVTPEVNLREHTSHMPPPSANKAAHSGFETRRRCHQKSETGHTVCPPCVHQIFLKKERVLGQEIDGFNT